MKTNNDNSFVKLLSWKYWIAGLVLLAFVGVLANVAIYGFTNSTKAAIASFVFLCFYSRFLWLRGIGQDVTLFDVFVPSGEERSLVDYVAVLTAVMAFLFACIPKQAFEMLRSIS